MQIGKVAWRHVKRQTRATANCPPSISERVIRKTETRRKVIFVGLRFAEENVQRRIIRNRIQHLSVRIARDSAPFVAQPEIQNQSPCNLEVILHEPVDRAVVRREDAAALSLQRAVSAVRNQIVHERLQTPVVPLSARARQEYYGHDVASELYPRFQRVLAFYERQRIRTLVNVLGSALWRVAVWADVGAQLIDFNVWEICERGWNRQVREIRPRVGNSGVVDQVGLDGPGIRQDELVSAVLFRAVELRLWLGRVDAGRAEPVV